MGLIGRRPGSGRPSKMTSEVKPIFEEQMQVDDKTTAHQLHAVLVLKVCRLSLYTVLRCCTSLGWTFRGNTYCQLIHEANKEKRLLALAGVNLALDWDDVVWTDECTVQLETHWRFCYCKSEQRPKNKPRYMQILQYLE